MFFVERHGRYNTPHFCFIDSMYYKKHTFSYHSCFNHSEKVKKIQINAAFRNAVDNQIKEFKNNTFLTTTSIYCPVTGKPLYNNSMTHVDHDYNSSHTFKNIVDNFKTCYNLNDKDFDTVTDHTTKLYVFKNSKITQLFQDYHKCNASLRCISREANLLEIKPNEYIIK